MDALVPVSLFVLYFVPMIIAIRRRSRAVMGVAITSLILGWTVIGWLLGLGIALWSRSWNDSVRLADGR